MTPWARFRRWRLLRKGWHRVSLDGWICVAKMPAGSPHHLDIWSEYVYLDGNRVDVPMPPPGSRIFSVSYDPHLELLFVYAHMKELNQR